MDVDTNEPDGKSCSQVGSFPNRGLEQKRIAKQLPAFSPLIRATKGFTIEVGTVAGHDRGQFDLTIKYYNFFHEQYKRMMNDGESQFNEPCLNTMSHLSSQFFVFYVIS
eukprot:TRINITY_DN11538_c0_g1_i1.p1 TRINITY_DN11538_c0_g1~~TRINITY_DN11538_c0_g1_i1.p1  ORF type:complete len:109 (+),score=6.90 TRINITY_DN11538_c0_g1_i1:85-411(+)